MSYEYKKQIKDDLKVLHEMRKFAEWRSSEMTINDKYAELDHVYAQAAKADEYEAKAKDWDKLMFEIDEINDEAAVKGSPSKIIRAAKITALSNVMKERESGESYAKK